MIQKSPKNDVVFLSSGHRGGVRGAGGGGGGGKWEDLLRSLRKLVLKKFSLCQVRFSGPKKRPFLGANLRFFGARCLVNAFWCIFPYVLA